MLINHFTSRRRLLQAAAITPLMWRATDIYGDAGAPGRALRDVAAATRWLAPAGALPQGEARDLIAAVMALHGAGVTPAPGASAAPVLLRAATQAFDLIRKYRLNPLRAARMLSYLTVAMHDSVAAVAPGVAAVPPAPDDALASTRTAGAAALLCGGAVLAHWFPEEPRGKWPGWAIYQAAAHLGHGASGDAAAQAVDAAYRAAGAAIARSWFDRADPASLQLRTAPPGAAIWTAAPPLWSSRPVEPAAERWATWLSAASLADAVPPPSNQDAARYAAEIDEVLRVQRTLSLEQKRLADDWNLELGTLTPGGVWLERLLHDAAFAAQPLRHQSACLSLLASTIHDAFVACWRVKFKWWSERPVTAIRRLHDADFLPYLVTPSFPSHVSGHAAISGAAAAMLSAWFPADAARYAADAEAAALSRLYGGIHFRSDNDEGLRLGRSVAAAALARVRGAALALPLALPLLTVGG